MRISWTVYGGIHEKINHIRLVCCPENECKKTQNKQKTHSSIKIYNLHDGRYMTDHFCFGNFNWYIFKRNFLSECSDFITACYFFSRLAIVDGYRWQATRIIISSTFISIWFAVSFNLHSPFVVLCYSRDGKGHKCEIKLQYIKGAGEPTQAMNMISC